MLLLIHNIILIKIVFSYIKVWDLRKSYRQVKANIEPLPITKYFHQKKNADQNIGYSDMIINAQSSDLYANCINNTIYRYSLESLNKSTYLFYSIISIGKRYLNCGSKLISRSQLYF